MDAPLRPPPSGITQLLLDPKRWWQLFDDAPGFMAISQGPDHVFEMVNQAYMQLVGPRELIGKTVRETFPELEDQDFFTLLDHVYRTGKPMSGRGRLLSLRRTTGAELEERMLDFVFQPITDGAGKSIGIFAQGHDVTEQHKIERALHESEQRFKLIADSAPVPMWVTRLDRQRAFANIAYADFIGVSCEEALSFDWRTRIHPDDAARLLEESLAGEATLKPFVLEGRYLRGDGQWRWLRSESQPRWGPDGEHIGFIGVAHDITDAKEAQAKLREVNETLERRVAERTADLMAALDRLQSEVADRIRAEDALRQAQKMEAVGQLTGGIAHDFNNLLTPIMGGFEMIAGRLDDPRLRRIAETGLDAAQRGAKLTGQLLAFSRMQRISVGPVAVNKIIANLDDLLRQAVGNELQLVLELDEAVGHASCDANQLENAVLNLALNARDAMPSGGRLTVSTELVLGETGPDLRPGDYVRLTVADTGEGMSPDVLGRATEPFFSTKPTGKGTGLGLAQVYGIARHSGGALRIESELGKGTRISMMLPRADIKESESGLDPELVAYRAAQARAAEAEILVIDDDRDVRAFLTGALESLGYQVRQADCGEAGLKRLEEACPDLVLLDYAMPGMHGAEVAQIARQRHASLPIVFVTGYAVTEQLVAALGRDVPILRKPFTVAQLATIVEDQLGPTSNEGRGGPRHSAS